MKLREKTDLSTLRAMAASVKAAEAFAPTHPHAGVEVGDRQPGGRSDRRAG